MSKHSMDDTITISHKGYRMRLEELKALRRENAALRAWVMGAARVIEGGVRIMTLEQVSQWEGCRGALEDCPVEWK